MPGRTSRHRRWLPQRRRRRRPRPRRHRHRPGDGPVEQPRPTWSCRMTAPGGPLAVRPPRRPSHRLPPPSGRPRLARRRRPSSRSAALSQSSRLSQRSRSGRLMQHRPSGRLSQHKWNGPPNRPHKRNGPASRPQGYSRHRRAIRLRLFDWHPRPSSHRPVHCHFSSRWHRTHSSRRPSSPRPRHRRTILRRPRRSTCRRPLVRCGPLWPRCPQSLRALPQPRHPSRRTPPARLRRPPCRS